MKQKIIGKLILVAMLSMSIFLISEHTYANIQPAYHVCKNEYALCTSAQCIPNPNNPKGEAICRCDVHHGTNLGNSTCQQRIPKVVNDIVLVKSTFSFKQFGKMKHMTCPNKVAWSDCLDSNCTVDPINPKHAICNCKLKWSQASVTLGGNCDQNTCKTGYWSAATVAAAHNDIATLNKYLKTSYTFENMACKK